MFATYLEAGKTSQNSSSSPMVSVEVLGLTLKVYELDLKILIVAKCFDGRCCSYTGKILISQLLPPSYSNKCCCSTAIAFSVLCFCTM